MSIIDETNDFALVSQDPEIWYEHPQAVVDDPQLTVAEKRELLAEWAQDINDRTRSVGEGMAPDTTAKAEPVRVSLDQVAAAQAALEHLAEDAAPPTLAQRIWRRFTGTPMAG